MVCLGALIPKLKLLDISSMQKAIDFVVGNKKPELKELNIKAVSAGIKV
jgi:2-oxoglutarate ferredoxin oxidoreductase subunit gamma